MLLAAALLYARHHVVLAFIALTMGVTLLVLHFASPRASRRIDAWMAGLSRALGWLVARVLLLVVFYGLITPVGLLRRAAGIDPLRLRVFGGTQSYWEAPDRNDPTLAARQYLRERVVRESGGFAARVLALVGVCATLLVVNIAVGSWLRSRPTPLAFEHSCHKLDTLPAWRDAVDWHCLYEAEFLKSQTYEYPAFVGWHRVDSHASMVNVEHGARRTTQPPLPPDAKTVFVFGGSTLWGTAARDDHTIPSELAMQLAHDGTPSRVLNYGEGGYSLWQEAVTFELLLARGEHPDVVVFYDGINDVMLQVNEGPITTPTYYRARFIDDATRHRLDVTPVLDGNNGIAALLDAWGEWNASRDDLIPFFPSMPRNRKATAEELATAAAAVYTNGVRTVADLAAARGIATLFFWQPSLYSRATPLSPDEQFVFVRSKGYDTIRDIYARATAAVAHEPVIRLDNVLDDVSGPLYTDYLHVTERANRIIATAIAPHVEARLRTP